MVDNPKEGALTPLQRELQKIAAAAVSPPAEYSPELVDQDADDWFLLETIRMAGLADIFAKAGGLKRESLNGLRRALVQEEVMRLQTSAYVEPGRADTGHDKVASGFNLEQDGLTPAGSRGEVPSHDTPAAISALSSMIRSPHQMTVPAPKFNSASSASTFGTHSVRVDSAELASLPGSSISQPLSNRSGFARRNMIIGLSDGTSMTVANERPPVPSNRTYAQQDTPWTVFPTSRSQIDSQRSDEPQIVSHLTEDMPFVHMSL